MRIIAGQRRGHKIDGPRASTGTRPTRDLIREALFNILGDLVVDRLVVDLFAGTGALGLEALSRGARQALFVERDRENVGLIHRNIATLRYQDRAQVRHADAYRWARTFETTDGLPVVVFLDPPYREYEVQAQNVNRMLARLVEKLPPSSAVVLESWRDLDGRTLPEFATWDIRRYGSSQVALKIVSERLGGIEGPDSSAGPTVGGEILTPPNPEDGLDD
ncbi:MAG: 16S rRNA (guanine(966)-N(2))-methyltransferase RsmD [Isosphaeraceae bacterium]